MTATATRSLEILSRWIDAARRRKLGGSVVPLLWTMRDKVEGLRRVPDILVEPVQALLDEMTKKASPAQQEDIATVRKELGL